MKNFSELKTRDLLTKAQMQSVKGGSNCVAYDNSGAQK